MYEQSSSTDNVQSCDFTSPASPATSYNYSFLSASNSYPSSYQYYYPYSYNYYQQTTSSPYNYYSTNNYSTSSDNVYPSYSTNSDSYSPAPTAVTTATSSYDNSSSLSNDFSLYQYSSTSTTSDELSKSSSNVQDVDVPGFSSPIIQFTQGMKLKLLIISFIISRLNYFFFFKLLDLKTSLLLF